VWKSRAAGHSAANTTSTNRTAHLAAAVGICLCLGELQVQRSPHARQWASQALKCLGHSSKAGLEQAAVLRLQQRQACAVPDRTAQMAAQLPLSRVEFMRQQRQ
jgi:hypothetical protein